MSVIKGTNANFENEVLKSEKPVLVDFNATWCGPCRMLKPIVEEIANEKTDIKVVAIDVDEEGDLAGEYGVYSIPCLVVFKGGKEVKRTVGYQPKERLLDLFEGI